MDTAAVKETCTDPHSRNIKRLTMNDTSNVSEQIHGLMGKDVEARVSYYTDYCNCI